MVGYRLGLQHRPAVPGLGLPPRLPRPLQRRVRPRRSATGTIHRRVRPRHSSTGTFNHRVRPRHSSKGTLNRRVHQPQEQGTVIYRVRSRSTTGTLKSQSSSTP